MIILFNVEQLLALQIDDKTIEQTSSSDSMGNCINALTGLRSDREDLLGWGAEETTNDWLVGCPDTPRATREPSRPPDVTI